MLTPLELGKWLLTAPEDDEAIESFVLDNSDDYVESLISVLEHWDEITENFTPSLASQLIWRVISHPLWLRHCDISEEQWHRVCEAASLITHSISRIHAPGEPMETGFHMLWDLLSDVNRDTTPYLAKLIAYPDPRMKFSALHGLGHQGKARIPIIRKNEQRLVELSGREYVNQCLNGTIM